MTNINDRSSDAQELVEGLPDFEVLLAVLSLHDDGVVLPVQFDPFDFDAYACEDALHLSLHEPKEHFQPEGGYFAIFKAVQMYLQYISSFDDGPLDSLDFFLLHLWQVVHFILQQFVAITEIAQLLHVAVEGTDLSLIFEVGEVGLVAA